MPSKWRPYCETAPEKDSNTLFEISSHGFTRILDMATVQTIVSQQSYLVPVRISHYRTKWDSTGAQASLTYCNVSTVAPVNVRNSSNDVANTALVCRTPDQIRSYWLPNRRYTHVGRRPVTGRHAADRLTGRASNFVGVAWRNDLATSEHANFSVSNSAGTARLMMTTGSSSRAKTDSWQWRHFAFEAPGASAADFVDA